MATWLATNSTAITTIKKRWERAEFWLEVASVVGGLMVGVGLWVEGETSIGQRLVTGCVALEVICAWWVLVSSRKLQNILEREFETLRLETAQAKQKQAEAELHLGRLKEQVAWRHIPADEFVKALQDGPKARMVNVLYLRDDPECWSLAMEFIDVLSKASWPFSLPEPIKPNDTPPFSLFPSTLSIGANPTGISVEAREFKFPDWDDKTAFGVLTNAIVHCLGGVSPRENKSLPDGIFRIIVGPKEGRFFR